MTGLTFIGLEAWETIVIQLLVCYLLTDFAGPIRKPSRLGRLVPLMCIDLGAWEARVFQLVFWYLFIDFDGPIRKLSF